MTSVRDQRKILLKEIIKSIMKYRKMKTNADCTAKWTL